MVAVLLAGGTASAAGPITIIVGGMEKQIYLPVVLADRLGYFDEAGLEVRLVNADTGIEAQNQLLAGAAQAAVGFYDHTVTLQARGYYVMTLVQLGQAPGEVELVAPPAVSEVDTPAALKGRRLGVAGLGSSTDFLTRYIAHLNGLKFGDYTLVPIEAGERFIEAMEQGKVAAGMTSEPTAGRLLKRKGAKILVDLRTPEATRAAFGGCYPGASLYVRADWLARHREEAKGLVGVFVRTMRFIASHDAAAIADKLPESFFQDDREFYVQRLNKDKSMFTADGRMPAGCPEGALTVLTAINKAVHDRQIDLSRTYTNRMVDEALAALAAGGAGPDK